MQLTIAMLKTVSIHAPTWGATNCSLTTSSRRHCFNPRSHMGSDSVLGYLLTIQDCFNPRSHIGSDMAGSVKRSNSVVSIHAPTWGATQLNLFSSIDEMFQSTLPHGERLMFTFQNHSVSVFQSTLPHGERHRRVRMIYHSDKFQSTLPHGERLAWAV